MGVFKKDKQPVNVLALPQAALSAKSPTQRRITPPNYNPNATPGLTSPVPALYDVPRALTAAASVMTLSDRDETERFKKRRMSDAIKWQSDAWEYYDAIGEVKYSFNLVSSVVSRIRLYAGYVANPSETPMRVSDAKESEVSENLKQAANRVVERLKSSYGGQAGLLANAALNFSVTGECYLVQIPARKGSKKPESWDIRSTDELNVDSRGNYFIVPRSDIKVNGSQAVSDGAIALPSTAYVGRMWRSHARFSEEADSSMKAIGDLCEELLLLNRTFRAVAHSRLNAGAMYIPEGLAAAAAPVPDYPYDGEASESITEEESTDAFEEQLIQAMTTPIQDPESASAVVPLIIRGPAELGDKIKLFKFERSFDPALATRSGVVLDRILQGIDVPKDVITGLANVKYANALQIDESLYKAHIEPLMLLIVDSLTTMYFKPSLLASGFTEEEISHLVMWYDPSAVATRNDRAADADSGFDKYAISWDVWRKQHGFSESDAPTPDEVAIRMAIEKGNMPPELTQAILTAMAPDLIAKAKAAQQAESAAPIPPELQDALNGVQPSAPAEAPAEEAPPAPVPSEPEATPATDDISKMIDSAIPTISGQGA